MSTVGHPHLGPRRHWANQRSRPCHSSAWVQSNALHKVKDLKDLTDAVAEALPDVPRTPLSTLRRLARWLKAPLTRDERPR